MPVQQIVTFLNEIGIPVLYETIESPTFLPGILIRQGTIVVDEAKLRHPGDLLHEAGHLAVMPPGERALADGNLGEGVEESKAMGIEITAICWSYAACVHLKLDPVVVFHGDGYMDSSDWFIETYSSGNYIGLPLLEWMGLCYSEQRATEKGMPAFPHMIQWVRPEHPELVESA